MRPAREAAIEFGRDEVSEAKASQCVALHTLTTPDFYVEFCIGLENFRKKDEQIQETLDLLPTLLAGGATSCA